MRTPRRKSRRAICAGTIFGAIVSLSPAAVAVVLTATDQAAVDKAAGSMKWVGAYQCPTLGLPVTVRGMQTEGEVAAQQQNSWNFAQGQAEALRQPLQQRQSVLANAKPGDNFDAELARIDGQVEAAMARSGTALVNWALANWVEMAKVDSAFTMPATGPNPLKRFADRAQMLSAYATKVGRLPGAGQYVRPVTDKFDRCLIVAQNQVVEANADSIRAAMKTVRSPAEARAVASAYAVSTAGFQAAGIAAPGVMSELDARVAALEEEERVATETSARELAKRQAEIAAKSGPAAGTGGALATGGPATGPTATDDRTNLRIATTVVKALANRSTADAMKYLHADITMSSPLGSAHGKSEVQSALQRGFSSGNGAGSLGAPRIASGQIVSAVQSARGSGTMFFGFRDGLVISMQIR